MLLVLCWLNKTEPDVNRGYISVVTCQQPKRYGIWFMNCIPTRITWHEHALSVVFLQE